MHLLRRISKNLPARLWLCSCIVVTSVWLIQALSLMHFPHRLVGRWSYFIPSSPWPWKVTLVVFHDAPAPNVGPQLNPGLSYNPAVLVWYHKIPRVHYRRTLWFDWDTGPNFEISRTRNMIWRGRADYVRIPDVAAWAMWLPFIIAWLRKRRRHQMALRGYCPECLYNLTANTSGICPECGTPRVSPDRVPRRGGV